MALLAVASSLLPLSAIRTRAATHLPGPMSRSSRWGSGVPKLRGQTGAKATFTLPEFHGAA